MTDRALTLLGLVLLTSPFWVSAIQKARDLRGTVAEVEMLGLPGAPVLALGTITLQAVAPLLLVLDVLTFAAASALIGFTALASALGRAFWSATGPARKSKLIGFTANLGLIGGLLLVMGQSI